MDTTNVDINGLNLKDTVAALILAEININAIREELRPALTDRINALRDRRRRLMATEAKIRRENEALREHGRNRYLTDAQRRYEETGRL